MTNCFTKSDIDLLPTGLSVWVNSQPPMTDLVTNETYKSWPATHFSSGQEGLLTSKYSKAGHQRWGFIWANRRNSGPSGYNYKPNPTPGTRITHDGTESGKECRSIFSSIALANAATRIQIRHMLGLNWQAIQANNPSLTVLTYDDWRLSDLNRRSEIFNMDVPYEQYGITTVYRVGQDVALLTPFDSTLISKLDGVELDYECQDGRTDTQSSAFLELLRFDIQELAGKKAYLLVNPYNASGATKSGITKSVLADVFANWDFLSVWLHSPALSSDWLSVQELYNTQIAMLPPLTTTAQWKRLIIRFELGGDPGSPDPGTTIEDAEWLHSLLTQSGTLHPTAVYFHRNGAETGGDCSSYTNQKIRQVCY